MDAEFNLEMRIAEIKDYVEIKVKKALRNTGNNCSLYYRML